jgi:DNA-binding CsgD family transcriptional regulator
MITLERQSILNSEIHAAQTPAALSCALARVAHEFGFRCYMLIRMPDEEQQLLSNVLIHSNLPKLYIHEFDRQKLLPKWLLSPLSLASAQPICWMVDKSYSDKGMSFAPELVDLQRRFKLTTHLAIETHSHCGRAYRMRLSGDRPRLTQIELNEVGMLLLHAFATMGRIKQASRKQASGHLSVRELEVVKWTSQGKTSAEIGKILSLSDHTVNAYLTNAIRKLDCVNRTQLVAKALRLKLIA